MKHYIAITPARDEERLLPRLLVAMVAQTRRPGRWIVIDDGSADRTGEILDRAAQLPSLDPAAASAAQRHARAGRRIGDHALSAARHVGGLRRSPAPRRRSDFQAAVRGVATGRIGKGPAPRNRRPHAVRTARHALARSAGAVVPHPRRRQVVLQRVLRRDRRARGRTRLGHDRRSAGDDARLRHPQLPAYPRLSSSPAGRRRRPVARPQSRRPRRLQRRLFAPVPDRRGRSGWESSGRRSSAAWGLWPATSKARCSALRGRSRPHWSDSCAVNSYAGFS